MNITLYFTPSDCNIIDNKLADCYAKRITINTSNEIQNKKNIPLANIKSYICNILFNNWINDKIDMNNLSFR